MANTSIMVNLSSSDWTLILAVIAAATGVIMVSLELLSKFRSKQIYRPALTFNIGLLYANPNTRKILKNKTISTLIFGTSVHQKSEVVFSVPYLMMNYSKLPISNVTLQLQYSSKYAINVNDKIMNLIDKDKEIELELLSTNSEWEKKRQVQIVGPNIQVRYNFPLLRPGEEYVITDPIKFSKINPYNKSDYNFRDYGINTVVPH